MIYVILAGVVSNTAASLVHTSEETPELQGNFPQSQQSEQGSSFSRFLEQPATPQQETSK